MSIKDNLEQINIALEKLEESGVYDAEKYSYSLMHQTGQLEYFYCHLVKDGDCDNTFYDVWNRPQVHEIAYFNMGRGFPKELMDGHWCYVVKDMKYKMLVIPCTIIKKDSHKISKYEKDIEISKDNHVAFYRMQLSDMKGIDMQRIDLRKPFYKVLTPRDEIISFIQKNIF